MTEETAQVFSQQSRNLPTPAELDAEAAMSQFLHDHQEREVASPVASPRVPTLRVPVHHPTFSVYEVSELLRVHHDTIRRWIKTGRLYTNKIRGCWAVDPYTLMDLDMDWPKGHKHGVVQESFFSKPLNSLVMVGYGSVKVLSLGKDASGLPWNIVSPDRIEGAIPLQVSSNYDRFLQSIMSLPKGVDVLIEQLDRLGRKDFDPREADFWRGMILKFEGRLVTKIRCGNKDAGGKN